MVSRNFAPVVLAPWVSNARLTCDEAPVMNSLMPRCRALIATRFIALAAVESSNGTAAKSTTKALCLSAMQSSTVPTPEAAAWVV